MRSLSAYFGHKLWPALKFPNGFAARWYGENAGHAVTPETERRWVRIPWIGDFIRRESQPTEPNYSAEVGMLKKAVAVFPKSKVGEKFFSRV